MYTVVFDGGPYDGRLANVALTDVTANTVFGVVHEGKRMQYALVDGPILEATRRAGRPIEHTALRAVFLDPLRN